MEIKKGEIITLSDNREYMCLGTIIAEDNRKYLYLMTTSEPIEFCFAEENIIDDDIQMRIVGGKDEKRKLFDLLKMQLQNNSKEGVHYG